MFARSVLWSTREIEERLDRLNDESELRGRTVTMRQSDMARSTLREIVELLRGADLHQPSNPADRADEALERLLATMYANRSARVETVTDLLSDGRATITTLKEHSQIETGNGEVFVPLRGVQTGNWPSVLRVLIHRLGKFVGNSRDVLAKLRADGTGKDETEYLLVQSLLDRLQCLREVLRAHLSQLQVVNYTVFIDSQIDQFMSQAVPNAFGIDTSSAEILQ